jgi:phosphatidylglycerol---prolipoprotein diacylglyceryl transferase
VNPLGPIPAVIEFSFDPVLRFGEVGVRIETIVLAIVIVVALVVAARIAVATPVDIARAPSDPGPTSDELNHLRADDLLYIVVASVPGAVIGGRIGYVLLHLDYYGANPGAIIDPSQGGLALSLAVVGGTLTAATVAWLLGAPVGRWLHVAALPLLFVLSAGKAALILGGDGQGVPIDLAWATAYLPPGPWGSLAPEIPSHPSQAYEAVVTGLVLLGIAALASAGGFRRRDGRVFLVAVGLWALGRVVVAFTWRDELVLGPLRMEQLVSLALAVGALGGFAVLAARSRQGIAADGGMPGGGGSRSGPEWPDPETRPPF